MPFLRFSRRKIIVALLTSCLLFLWSTQTALHKHTVFLPNANEKPVVVDDEPRRNSFSESNNDQTIWARVPQRHPVRSMIPIPSPVPSSIPKIQHKFGEESSEARRVRTGRLDAVKGNFTHAWRGYKTRAWMSDEVKPISGEAHNPFGGWAATLVDALDTLWIIGLHDEFEEAVQAIAKVNFSRCALEEYSVFETTIRYLGGLLSAYDLSGEKYPSLLTKAIELGQMLYVAFDTPNRIPITHPNFIAAAKGAAQKPQDSALAAELGSLTLEFTRLSQLTNDPRYFDAAQRLMDIFEEHQSQTRIPGLWPVVINTRKLDFTRYGGFTIGGMADSLYEYLPKQHILLGGATKQYRKLYQNAMTAIKRHILYRPMTKGGEDILLPGNVWADGNIPLSELKADGEAQHLGCFAGGMVAIGAKIFNNPEEVDIARKLANGCVWAYETANQGIMPEIMHTVPCEDRDNCPWNETKWHEAVNRAYPFGNVPAEQKIRAKNLPPGVTKIGDARYILRPEAIESVFVLYRVTGDPSFLEKAWKMFNAIVENTITDIAHAALDDCTLPDPPKADRMESFWLAETLKYFYLIFAEPDVVSLDEYVLNTEAHPLKRSV
ncbi:endoplasmic reticulum mannosyl-oligosaccharide 1,2-alpha-mannosidase, putative [Coccidioides posadasii C735 delta SOWgp]|uniref:alpha-1,2-Mannosidase n=1 Tax=Coccidioides posadasii (strain C735) TaxID=222929 RepID=C5PDF4_COCP7|nr:endoplasmic reticulum mannosyl-oligosaccharide 1,2-alpha-mannosidase, putative [Coccidioides posadasii C735 delta SOWgp]EER25115.1 endoplasmic reticulum mannosyl-oligosaccharide 1,2-alpha-mannosidase, putative [Coccidioides posadasii C735 delta SOWgp]|eukprot:XP_003067260.1 endoplasmic reticulum mannosyl-oligosaccharide 1,2-alpha-mannosidase, putative [Coccidioides posadasii C735 delta SOWgp]